MLGLFGLGRKPAFKMMDKFIAVLKREGIKYDVSKDKPYVYIKYKGDNFDSLTFSFFFDEDGESVALKVFSIVEFQPNQLLDAYEYCNKMNASYRWIKFYVDDDNELTADMDAVINERTVGEECYELLGRAVRIVDKACGELN